MPRGKTQRSLMLLNACHDILETIHPATVRAVCYQLFLRQLLPSMAKTCPNRVSDQLVYAREHELIPWSWIVDETREAERPGTWANPGSEYEWTTYALHYISVRLLHKPHRRECFQRLGHQGASLLAHER
jgi:hypothetical protein